MKLGFKSRGMVRIEELTRGERMPELVVGEVVHAVVERVAKMVVLCVW